MIPFKKKKYRIKVPIDVYTSDNPINPPVGKDENGLDQQLNALTFTNKNPQLTQMVEVFGEGGDGSLVLEPKKIDFGIVKVNFNKMLTKIFSTKNLRFFSNNSQHYIDLELQHGCHNYLPVPVVLSRGQNCHVWDVEGNKFLDCIGAYGAVGHGHCHPAIYAAMIKQ